MMALYSWEFARPALRPAGPSGRGLAGIFPFHINGMNAFRQPLSGKRREMPVMNRPELEPVSMLDLCPAAGWAGRSRWQ